MHISVALIVALMVLPACSSRPPAAASHEFLDEQTGTTLSVVAKPLVFARERTDVAAHARDYATLIAVEVDSSGKYSDYLLLFRWSTVDPRMSPAPDPHAGELKILAESRVIDLMPLEQMPVSLSLRRELHLPEHGGGIAHSYSVDAATLHFIAMSRELTVLMPQESLDTPFQLWEDGRKALEQFAQRASGP
jgi:hypothetical protein